MIETLGDAGGGPDVQLRVVLHRPTGLAKPAVDLLACPLFGRHISTSPRSYASVPYPDDTCSLQHAALRAACQRVTPDPSDGNGKTRPANAQAPSRYS